jgi:coproporphyrinogen III oxidase
VFNQTQTSAFRESWISFIHDLQNQICKDLEDADGRSFFGEDRWERAGGGGGKTKILADGKLIEKGGVNTSVVFGKVNDIMREQLKIDGSRWFACGLSTVIHPVNPYVPTVHGNWRYFELYDEAGSVIDRWFGGGADLTPYYIFEEDARHFHQTFKEAMDPMGREWYPKFKKQCDEYFANKHRNNEMRGIGGVFYDFLRPADDLDAQRLFQFQVANGNAFLKAYLPIVNRRKSQVYGEREIEWQEVRRGRYVEFNLLYDRGTSFGLRTNGRTESILMSLPPRARWNYNYEPVKGSEEDKLWQVCLHPKEWIPV